MTMTTRAAAALLALGMAAAAAPVAAATTASASIEAVHFQVIDLDPNDGITAAITFADASAIAYAYVAAGTLAGQNVIASDGGSGLPGTAQSALVTLTGAQAGGTVLAGELFGATGPAAQVTAGVSQPGLAAYTHAFAIYSTFTLTPHTQLILTASTSAQADLGAGSIANARAELYASSADMSQFERSWSYVLLSPGIRYEEQSPQAYVSFMNQTDSQLEGYLAASTMASVEVAAVPEASTAATLMAGLAVLAALRRRRPASRD